MPDFPPPVKQGEWSNASHQQKSWPKQAKAAAQSSQSSTTCTSSTTAWTFMFWSQATPSLPLTGALALSCSPAERREWTPCLRWLVLWRRALWQGQHLTAGWTGRWYGAGGKLRLATTPDSVLQATATDKAVPALQVKIIVVVLYEVNWCCAGL